MPIEFRYRLERGAGGVSIARPVAQATLRGPSGREIVQFFYIDSGADFTVIPYGVGHYLGLTTHGQAVREVQGINGAVGVIYARLHMTIGSVSLPVEVAWAQLEHVPLLLGRKDVFDKFEIIFRQWDGIVEFREVSLPV